MTSESLAVGALKNHRTRGELIDVGCFADLIAVAPQDTRLQVVSNEKENVSDLLFASRRVQSERKQEGDEEELPDHEEDLIQTPLEAQISI